MTLEQYPKTAYHSSSMAVTKGLAYTTDVTICSQLKRAALVMHLMREDTPMAVHLCDALNTLSEIMLLKYSTFSDMHDPEFAQDVDAAMRAIESDLKGQ